MDVGIVGYSCCIRRPEGSKSHNAKTGAPLQDVFQVSKTLCDDDLLWRLSLGFSGPRSKRCIGQRSPSSHMCGLFDRFVTRFRWSDALRRLEGSKVSST